MILTKDLLLAAALRRPSVELTDFVQSLNIYRSHCFSISLVLSSKWRHEHEFPKGPFHTQKAVTCTYMYKRRVFSRNQSLVLVCPSECVCVVCVHVSRM